MCILVQKWVRIIADQTIIHLLICITTIFKFYRRLVRPMGHLHYRIAALAVAFLQLFELEEPILLTLT